MTYPGNEPQDPRPPVWNILVPVVACRRAGNAGDAIAELHDALVTAGFDVYDDPGGTWTANAFEAEAGTEVTPFPGEDENAPGLAGTTAWVKRTGLPGNLREPWRE